MCFFIFFLITLSKHFMYAHRVLYNNLDFMCFFIGHCPGQTSRSRQMHVKSYHIRPHQLTYFCLLSCLKYFYLIFLSFVMPINLSKLLYKAKHTVLCTVEYTFFIAIHVQSFNIFYRLFAEIFLIL